MSDYLFRREIYRRAQAAKTFKLEEFLFKEQLDFVRDPAPFKTAVCSRRAGKTISCAADLCETAFFNPDTTCLYITLARNNAKKLIWPEIKKINRIFNLGGDPNEADLSMKFPNGSIIYCSGASNIAEIEKFRGLALKKVYLDECQSFPAYIKVLIDDILSPALMDYAGSLILIGTPGPVPVGFFYDCSVSAEWAHHEWTYWQNPHIETKSGLTHQQTFDRELKRRGVTAEDPSIQREWFGKWKFDPESLVFRYSAELNDYQDTPHQPSDYTFIMGVDFGYEDADAIAILGWSEKTPITYLVDELVMPKQGITELVEQIEIFRKKYQVSKIVADFGGLGKKISEEIIRRWQVPVEAADKVRKFEAIELMNDALRTQRFMAKKSSRFAADAMLVEWDKEKSTPEKKKISDRFHSDILDAALYAFRLSPAYAYAPPIPKPTYGTDAWMDEQIEKMEEHALEQARKENLEEEWSW